jgi:hypothetical protein
VKSDANKDFSDDYDGSNSDKDALAATPTNPSGSTAAPGGSTAKSSDGDAFLVELDVGNSESDTPAAKPAVPAVANGADASTAAPPSKLKSSDSDEFLVELDVGHSESDTPGVEGAKETPARPASPAFSNDGESNNVIRAFGASPVEGDEEEEEAVLASSSLAGDDDFDAIPENDEPPSTGVVVPDAFASDNDGEHPAQSVLPGANDERGGDSGDDEFNPSKPTDPQGTLPPPDDFVVEEEEEENDPAPPLKPDATQAAKGATNTSDKEEEEEEEEPGVAVALGSQAADKEGDVKSDEESPNRGLPTMAELKQRFAVVDQESDDDFDLDAMAKDLGVNLDDLTDGED